MDMALSGIIIVLVIVLLGMAWSMRSILLRSGGDASTNERLHQTVEPMIERLERGVREEFVRNRSEVAEHIRQLRVELGAALRDQRTEQSTRMERLTASNEERLQSLREVIDQRLFRLQEDNASKLEQMRQTVDEKLHATLERRLGESFKQVSERLEQVHQGLGEMQMLATGVGDLKRILTNVKARGTWGEVQLQSLLEQVLTADQYAVNVAVNPQSSERVEFAIRLPGKDGAGGGSPVWLPIDAKFPQEDYQRLLDAYDGADAKLVEDATKALEARIRDEAKTIQQKYIVPPHTTDFAVMFLPTEGLYAEVIRRQSLMDRLQRDYRVVPAGPTTLTALLNSLQMGFRTVAIEKRSSEVWQVLGAVKTEFSKFGDVLDKVHKKIEQASSEFDVVTRRTRAIQRRLTHVEALPQDQTAAVMSTDSEWSDEADVPAGMGAGSALR